jgi:hypothetical protein
MNWKLKARVQNFVALIPSRLSYATYYWLQRHFGGLRQVDPRRRLAAGIEIWRRIQRTGHSARGKVLFEVGTGHIPLVPLAYWLMGAEKTITIDLNPYLKADLVEESVAYITRHSDEILTMFGSLSDTERFKQLVTYGRGSRFNLSDFLAMCSIEYIAPGDAASTTLDDQSVDFHTSTMVFEHIPLPQLEDILREGHRIIRPSGLFAHYIDYSDHFAHTDRSISAINFLQYSDAEWSSYADNRYMYMNRLRHDDFLGLFASLGHTLLQAEEEVDSSVRELLASGRLPVAARFASKPTDILSVIGAWIVTQR